MGTAPFEPTTSSDLAGALLRRKVCSLEAEVQELRGLLDTKDARIRGVLALVSTALDTSPIPGPSFNAIADHLQKTFGADGAVFYLVHNDGFHPMGTSSGFHDMGISPVVLPWGKGLPSLVARRGSAVCLQRVGSAADGNAVMLEVSTQTRLKIGAMMAAHCATMVGVPIVAQGSIIAVMTLGWREHSPFLVEDAELLTTIAGFLSLQFAAIHASHEQELAVGRERVLESMRGLVRAAVCIDAEGARKLACDLQKVIPAHYLILSSNQEPASGVMTFFDGPELTQERFLESPLTVADVFPQGISVVKVNSSTQLGMWLGRSTNLDFGYAINLTVPHSTEGAHVALLAMRSADDPVFDAAEDEFMGRLASQVYHELSSETERAHDSRIAEALQAGLRNVIPQFQGLTAQSLYRSATAGSVVGGDFFDAYEVAPERVVFVMGDVSGKGVEAAAMASLVKTALAAYAWDWMPPAIMVESLNKLVLNFSRLETFASVVVIVFDKTTGQGAYCSAGHMPAMVVRRGEDQCIVDLLTVQSPIVGAFDGMRYDEGTFWMDPGDVLFLYTDGTTEARDPAGEFFGEDNLCQLLASLSALDVRQLPQAVLQRVEEWSGGSMRDDIALLAIRRD